MPRIRALRTHRIDESLFERGLARSGRKHILRRLATGVNDVVLSLSKRGSAMESNERYETDVGVEPSTCGLQ
jgi:hypothetical protein